MKVEPQTYLLPSTFTPEGGILLDLQYNNSNVDISDNPKVITANGTETYVNGLYGEELSARKFTSNTQYDSWSNTVEQDLYSVSGWIKVNTINTQNYLISSDNDDGNTTFSSIDIRLVISGGISYVVVSWGTPINATPVFYGGSLQGEYGLGEWIHITLLLDSISKEVKLYVNSRDVTNRLVAAGNIVRDLTKIEPFPIATINHGRKSNYNPATNTDCNIYNVKVSNYLMSAEEIKADFKKYPKI